MHRTGSHEINLDNTRDISPEVLDDRGRFRILPASYWATTTVDERALFGHLNAIYSFPTVELVEYLKDVIGGRKAIEIGAGNGVLADALGIIATDNKSQNKKGFREYQELTDTAGQPPVKYGRRINEMDARAAVRRYDPDVVIGCWVTHRYEPSRHWAGGNIVGIDEADVLAHCKQYVVVGNEQVHQNKAIWDLPHTKITPDWLFSRATNGSPNFIAIWEGGKA